MSRKFADFSPLLRRLWEQYRKKLFVISYKILGDRQDSEDAVSEAYVRLSSHIERYSELEENQLLALLITITKNIARDKLKSRRDSVSFEDCECEPSGKPGVETMVLSSENVKRIEREIENLSDTYRDVIKLRLYVELSFREISEALGIPEATARKRYQRGIEILRERLGDYYDE